MKENVNVFDVAQWFLSKHSMTHKKLQKLCYYAQAWYCALYDGSPFFKENFQAWVHGPVCRELYPKYADYGWSHIPQTEDNSSIFSEEQLSILEAVFDLYDRYTGDQLEEITHSEEPWLKQRVGLKDYQPSDNVIRNEDMRSYYLSEYQRSQND